MSLLLRRFIKTSEEVNMFVVEPLAMYGLILKFTYYQHLVKNPVQALLRSHSTQKAKKTAPAKLEKDDTYTNLIE